MITAPMILLFAMAYFLAAKMAFHHKSPILGFFMMLINTALVIAIIWSQP